MRLGVFMKQTLADTAYAYLLEKIYSSELKSGDKISEQTVIENLNISRTPVREAIRRMASDGLIDFYPGTFARVHTFTSKEKLDMGAVRLAIDSLAAQLAVLNGSNRDFQDLMAVAAKCQRASDEKDFMERIRLDCEFHAALSSISGNRELISIQQRLSMRSRLMQIQAYNEKGSSSCDLAGHLDIIRALMDRNVNACLAAIQSHLRHFYTGDEEATLEWNAIEPHVQMSVFPLK